MIYKGVHGLFAVQDDRICNLNTVNEFHGTGPLDSPIWCLDRCSKSLNEQDSYFRDGISLNAIIHIRMGKAIQLTILHTKSALRGWTTCSNTSCLPPRGHIKIPLLHFHVPDKSSRIGQWTHRHEANTGRCSYCDIIDLCLSIS